MSELRLQSFAKTVGLTSLIVTGLVVSLRLLGAFEASELLTYGRFVRRRPPAPMDERVLVVGIEDEDIQELEQYPLYDGTLAEVLGKLEAQNPVAIGVDIGRDVPQGPAAGRQQLLEIIGRSDRIIMACLMSHAEEPGLGPPPGTPVGNVAFADLPLNPDGVIRRTALVSSPAEPPSGTLARHVCNDASPDNELLSLSFLTSMMYLENLGIVPAPAARGGIELGPATLSPLKARAGGYAQTEATDFQLMLNYRAPRAAIRRVNLRAVLEDQVDPSWIEGRIVLIGYTSQVAKDIVQTPYLKTGEGQRGMPGVVVHAQAASQLLSTALDGRPLMRVWPVGLEVIWIGLWALSAGALVFYSQRLSWFALLAGLLSASNWVVVYLLFAQGWWVPLIPCLWAMVITAAAVGLLDRANQGGYTRAILEQLQEQLEGNSQRERDRSDYLAGLVQRARAVRLNRSGRAIAPATLETDPLNLQFDSPEMQRIYEAMRRKAEQEAQRNARQIAVGDFSGSGDAETTSRSGLSRRQLGRLIHRARAARGDEEKPLWEHIAGEPSSGEQLDHDWSDGNQFDREHRGEPS